MHRQEEAMEAYVGFAAVYDLFMDNIPYEEWCRNIVEILNTKEFSQCIFF